MAAWFCVFRLPVPKTLCIIAWTGKQASQHQRVKPTLITASISSKSVSYGGLLLMGVDFPIEDNCLFAKHASHVIQSSLLYSYNQKTFLCLLD